MFKLINIIFFVFSILFLSGCGSMKIIVPENTVDYPESKKINIDVNIEITDSINNASYNLMGNESNSYRIGDNLKRNIEKLSAHIFTKYKLLTNEDSNKYNYTLTPEFIKAEGSIGMWATVNAETIIIMQWTLKKSNGDIVWVDTVSGVGKSISGYGIGSENVVIMSNSRINDAINNVFLNSYHSIYESSVIKNLQKSN